MEKVDARTLLPGDAVTRVDKETAVERIVRLLLGDITRVTALITITVGLIGSLLILICVESLRPTAFQLFSTIISAALGFFFGSREVGT